jgi:TM2 domain-containing membrane protein YozV/ribosomal protein S27AE
MRAGDDACGRRSLSTMRLDGSRALPTSYKTCPRCGLTLASEVAVCGRCGNRFAMPGDPLAPPPPLPTVSVPQFSAPPPVPANPDRKQKVVAIAIALGLGPFGAHGFYLGNKAMGWALAVMFFGGAAVAMFLYVLALMGVVSVWLTAIGLVPLLAAGAIPLIQVLRYSTADPEQFQQRYVVEKRWF